MQVYNAYFKIVKKHLMPLLIYLGISMAMFMIISASLKGQTSAQFSESRSTIAIINNDGDSPLVSGLESYLSTKAQLVPIKDNEEEIQDALFYGNVSYVLRIPKGFSQDFLAGNNDIALEKSTSDDSASGISLTLLVNKYLNLAEMYVKNVPGMPTSEIATDVISDLNVSSEADYASTLEQTTTNNLSFYFRIIAYSIMAIMISGVTNIMMSFNMKDFSMRNLCSPMSMRKMNGQLVLANGTFALVVWALSCAFIFVIYGRFMLSAGIALMCLNALIFTISSLGIGFLAAKFVKEHISQAALTNVISLGTSFICGVFVSQSLLGPTVLKIASFTPGFWYIKAIQDIKNLSSFTSGNIMPIVNSMLIQLGFAVSFILIALAVSKQRRTETA